jgi:hypothetical protein
MKQPQQNTRDRREKGILQSLKTFLKGDDRDQFLPPIALSKVISGTVEVRLPFERVVQQPFVGSGTVVVFGDWCVAQAQQLSSSTTSPPGETGDFEQPFRQSSIGIGLRKVVQGIPLKMDACVTEHGTKGLFFGIGNN